MRDLVLNIPMTTATRHPNTMTDQFTDELFDAFQGIWDRIVTTATNPAHFGSLVVGFGRELRSEGRPRDAEAWDVFSLRKVREMIG